MTRSRVARRSTALAAPAAVLFVLLCGFEVPAAQVAAPAAPSAAAPHTVAYGAPMLAAIQALTAPGMDGRAAGTSGGAKARAWIESRLRTIGARPLTGEAYGQTFALTTSTGETVKATNLLAVCPGTRADGRVIVVSAHYDHLGVRNGQTYHGADDNASGVAMLLTVAERCVTTPFAHTLVLAAFDAEERGLQGAKAFLAAPPIPVDRIDLSVNFDMVSRSERREIYAAGPGRWPRLLPVLTAAVREAPIAVKFGHDTGGGQDDWTQQSDHGVFHAAGIPFVYFGVEDHADYHKPTDTADKIDPAFLDGVAAVVLSSLTALDRAPAVK